MDPPPPPPWTYVNKKSEDQTVNTFFPLGMDPPPPRTCKQENGILNCKYLCSHIADFTGNQVVSRIGDCDAADRISVSGHKSLLSVSSDGPGHDARPQRIKGSEAVRRTNQSVLNFSWNRNQSIVHHNETDSKSLI
jgi:hypothetical protein